MIRCIACRNRRRFARYAGVSYWSWTRVCYGCWMRRRAMVHIAGRALGALLFAMACVLAIGVAWQWAGRVWR